MAVNYGICNIVFTVCYTNPMIKQLPVLIADVKYYSEAVLRTTWVSLLNTVSTEGYISGLLSAAIHLYVVMVNIDSKS